MLPSSGLPRQAHCVQRPCSLMPAAGLQQVMSCRTFRKWYSVRLVYGGFALFCLRSVQLSARSTDPKNAIASLQVLGLVFPIVAQGSDYRRLADSQQRLNHGSTHELCSCSGKENGGHTASDRAVGRPCGSQNSEALQGGQANAGHRAAAWAGRWTDTGSHRLLPLSGMSGWNSSRQP